MNHESENDDHIDKSCWLPEGMPIVTPERELMGDMLIERWESGDIKFAQAQVRNVMRLLWEREIITDEHFHDGATFQIWRDVHQTSLGFRKAISSGDTESFGIRLRAFGYVLLLQRLNRYDQRAIEMAIETFISSHTADLALRNKVAYRRAFDNLSIVLLPIRERISYLEGLSDAERISLSEEHLKKLVAEIKKNA